MNHAILMLPLAALSLGCSTPANHTPEPISTNRLLVRFSRDSGTEGWRIQNDAVMGGLSRGRLDINEAGNALFTGDISLDNNGGFSSIQKTFDPMDVSAYRALGIGLKGDGQRYQVRVESTRHARHGYAFTFETSGDWQVIEIPFDEMFAIRHGDRLDLPNYPGQTLARIQILAGDGRPGPFRLELDRIWLQ